jgi:hypothetical protein
MVEMCDAQQAVTRVLNSTTLSPYYDLLCEYDWPNIHQHIEWVCTAPEEELLDWARGIRQDEAVY